MTSSSEPYGPFSTMKLKKPTKSWTHFKVHMHFLAEVSMVVSVDRLSPFALFFLSPIANCLILK